MGNLQRSSAGKASNVQRGTAPDSLFVGFSGVPGTEAIDESPQVFKMLIGGRVNGLSSPPEL